MTTKHILPPEYRALPATGDDRRWMDLIVDELRGWPKHSGTKHVSIVTGPDGQFRSLGFNGLPRGLDDGNPAFAQHPLKRQMTMCAERNALLNLRSVGVSAEGCTLHADAVPCAACATAIVESGIATVVMADVEVHSHAHADDFWRSGLEILLASGVGIRRHDLAIAKYNVAAQKIYHPPLQSGSVDWDSRFLSLARYAERWDGDMAGEVVARRPSATPHPADKIVRALGGWSRVRAGALETAASIGNPISDCTLYLSNPQPLTDPDRIVDTGVKHVILSDSFAGNADVRRLTPVLRRVGVVVGLHHVTTQDYSSLVARQHPGKAPAGLSMNPQDSHVQSRNEDQNYVV